MKLKDFFNNISIRHFCRLKLRTQNFRITRIEASEFGRSMVEMLGVLAVIGVLSVTAIIGYKYAMTKYIANETINELNLRAHDISLNMDKMIEQNYLGDIQMSMGPITRMGYPITARVSPKYIDYFEIFIKNVPSDVCRELLRTSWTAPYSIFVGVQEYEASVAVCNQADEVELAYEFYKDLTPKDNIDEDNRHETQRCNHDNNCMCGTCNTEQGLCESFCLTNESCKKDYDDPRWMVCCDKEYIKGDYCCASVTEDGQCCNREGQCCPPDKPLQDKNGVCHSCDDTKQIILNSALTDNCETLCPNRKAAGNYCVTTCPPDKPLQDKNGICHSCDEINGIQLTNPDTCSTICPKRFLNNQWGKYCVLCGAEGTAVEDKPIWDFVGNCYACNDTRCIDGESHPLGQAATAANCSRACSNRVKNGKYCCPVCSGDKPLLATDNKCYGCDDTTHSILNEALTDNCETLCPNRKTEGNYCVATCPPDKPLQDKNGICHSCDEINGIQLTNPDTCSTVCPKRFLNNQWGKYCVLCGAEGTAVEDKPIWDFVGNCYACDDTRCIDGESHPLGQAATAANCSRACPNRVKNGKYCCPVCSGDKPLLATDNKCYGCDDTTHRIPNSALMDNCETLCPNRKTEGDYCVATCPPDKPLQDKYGQCHSCDEINGIQLTNPDTCSTICPKRFLNNQWGKYCVLCGAEGTAVEDKPIWDFVGNCYACDDTRCIDGENHPLGQAATAANCSRACPNRVKNGKYCCPICTGDTPLLGDDWQCHDCNYTGTAELATCGETCSNWSLKDGKCVRTSCAVGTFANLSNVCFKCNITTNIASTEEECNRCINRIFQDGYCKVGNE